MDGVPAAEITVLLRAWGGGDPLALERLAPLISKSCQGRAALYAS